MRTKHTNKQPPKPLFNFEQEKYHMTEAWNSFKPSLLFFMWHWVFVTQLLLYTVFTKILFLAEF